MENLLLIYGPFESICFLFIFLRNCESRTNGPIFSTWSNSQTSALSKQHYMESASVG